MDYGRTLEAFIFLFLALLEQGSLKVVSGGNGKMIAKIAKIGSIP